MKVHVYSTCIYIHRVAWLGYLFDLASSFLPSHLSLKHVYTVCSSDIAIQYNMCYELPPRGEWCGRRS